MSTILGSLGSAIASVAASVFGLAGRPAQHLSSFMDGIDDVWLIDTFLD